MLSAVAFPAWEPDRAVPGTLVTAKNVYPLANGYKPVKAFENITTAPLVGEFLGGGAFKGSDGSSVLLVASASGLNRYDSGAYTSVNTLSAAQRWFPTQFGDDVIWAQGAQLVAYNILSGLAAPIAGAPTATDVATIGDFVVAIGLNSDNFLTGWSAFNNSASWPLNGTDQSDTQPLLSGGKGVRIVGGEYGIILQDHAIKRLTPVGGDVVFDFAEVSSEIGCMAAGSVVNVDKLIFWLSERGFMQYDGAQIQPIGESKFNSWFFSRFSRDDIANIWAAIDPRRTIVMWAMPGSPGTAILYDWTLQKAATLEIDLSGLFSGFTASTSLEGIDTLYPGGIDTVDVSLDSPRFAGGSPLLMVVDTAGMIGTLTGANIEATLRIVDIEPASGRRARIRALRPISDAVSASAIVNARMRAGDAEGIVTTSAMRSNGKMPLRSNGRYNDLTLSIPAGERWTYLQGCEVEFEAGDAR